MTPSWLTKILEAAAVLDLSHPDARERLAAMLIEAWPREHLMAAVSGSASAVLRVQGAKRELALTSRQVEQLADEIGRNATQAVLGVLSVDMSIDVGGGMKPLEVSADTATRIEREAARRGVAAGEVLDDVITRALDREGAPR